MAIFDRAETAKIRGWVDYLTEGGLDRPVSAAPFGLIDMEDSRLELAEFLGGVLTLAVMSGPDEARAATEGFLTDPDFADEIEEEVTEAMSELPLSDALDSIEATDEMLSQATALIGLLAMWHDGNAKPMQPAHTLRKMVLEPHNNQWDMSGA